MILFDHSTYDGTSIRSNLGAPEYSYWFVRKAFQPMLRRFGIVMPAPDPLTGLADVAASARAHGEQVLLLSFNPPQHAPVDIDIPVVPVFAWEFDRIPDEDWNANALDDWRLPLARVPAAITHSSYAVDAIRATMGADYPVWSIPAPVYDANAARFPTATPVKQRATLLVDGGVAIDTHAIDLALFGPGRAFTDGARAINLLHRALADPDRAPQRLTVDGVVYTSVFNPADGRKNWDDLTTAFVWAFRDRADATLIVKVTHADLAEGVLQVLEHIGKLGPFRCRVIVIQGLLTDDSYASMVEASSYCVNSSQGEGQCLPLMEFMSAGRPAVAPDHSAMRDYVTPANAFVVDSIVRPGFWPQDERRAFRCLRYEVRFDAFVRAYRQSFRIATTAPDRYAAMSAAARAALRDFCSDDVVADRLAAVFAHLGAPLRSETAVPTSRVDPYQMGLHDAVLSGWYDRDTGELAPRFPIEAEDIVADIGCGDGGPIEFCARRGARLILCDADAARLEATTGRIRAISAQPVDARVGDVQALPLPDDAATRVVCMEVLEHVDDPDAAMAELVRIGRPGALYLVTVPGAESEHVVKAVAPSTMFEKPNHIRIFERGQLRALIERAGLTVEFDGGYGFYWSVLFAVFWQTGVPLGASHPLLDLWARFWSDALADSAGHKVKRAFDAVIPRVQMIVARKPAAAA